MTNRITMKDLKNQVRLQNINQLISGSNYYAFIGERYNATYIDVYAIDEFGNDHCMSSAHTAGTKKDCYHGARAFHWDYHEQMTSGSKPTRIMAKKLFENVDVDFSADFHTVDSAIIDALIVWAKLTRYRKPKSANGSLARYFFANLARIKA